MNPSGWSPERLCAFLRDRGFGDLLPEWSEADIERISADGKIPKYGFWRDRLAQRQVGLDALMTVSGLRAFATDQKAMDDRIRATL